MRTPAVVLVVALVLAGCGDEASVPRTANPGEPERPPVSTLGERERPTSTTAPATTTTSARENAPGPTGAAPVVDLFYAIHVHAQAEWSPFVGPDLAELDSDAAQGYVDQVDAIARTLDDHDARGSFHFTFGTAAGLCRHDPGFFDDLERRGHEIGIHAHNNPFLLKAADEMRDACGRDVETGSGLMAMAGGPDGATRASLGASLQVFHDVGAAQLLVNLSDECGSASSAGNALQPWRATSGDVCAHDPAGIVMIDQVSLRYVITNGAPADVFSDAEFTILADLAEAAVAEAGSQPLGAIVAWGFVTHTNEYVKGGSPLAAPEPAALGGLDRFLNSIDPLVAAGRARWTTAAEIARRVP